MTIIITLYIICIALILFSYIGYPISLLLIRITYRRIYKPYTSKEDMPVLDVLISVRNEALVLEKKIRSVYNTAYPMQKLRVSVVSDDSDDGTDDILHQLKQEFPSLTLYRNQERKGKPANINYLARCSKAELLVLTDANVFFEHDTLVHLVKPFADKRIGLCGAWIMNTHGHSTGIAVQERRYIQTESYIKQLEGECFGSMIGPFGGCYAIRKDLFQPVPERNPVDDFYIGMSVLRQGKDAVLVPEALCYEDVPDEMIIEFRRKRRMANGNYRNAIHFLSLLSPTHPYTAYAFFSHKILRWFTPHLYLLSLIFLALLLSQQLFIGLALAQLILAFAVAIDRMLIRQNIHSGPLRFITYFCEMNFALLMGFIDFLKGKHAHVWEPTKRT